MRHPRFGAPRKVVTAAMDALEGRLGEVRARSPIIASKPVGPSLRRYANAALVLETRFDPPELLRLLKQIEREFGRRDRGQRWSARVLDLDIVLWSGGGWISPGLTIPHPLFRTRDFVLAPAAAIAGPWRDPLTGLTLSQLRARQLRPRRLPARLTTPRPLPR